MRGPWGGVDQPPHNLHWVPPQSQPKDVKLGLAIQVQLEDQFLGPLCLQVALTTPLQYRSSGAVIDCWATPDMGNLKYLHGERCVFHLGERESRMVWLLMFHLKFFFNILPTIFMKA